MARSLSNNPEIPYSSQSQYPVRNVVNTQAPDGLPRVQNVFGQGKVDVIYATGTYTPTAPLIRVTVYGGGGGGGAAAKTSQYTRVAVRADGGGGGGYARGIFSVTPGQAIQVTVGAAGSGGSVQVAASGSIGYVAAGQAGGTTSFGQLISATGGQGGRARNGYQGNIQLGQSETSVQATAGSGGTVAGGQGSGSNEYMPGTNNVLMQFSGGNGGLMTQIVHQIATQGYNQGQGAASTGLDLMFRGGGGAVGSRFGNGGPGVSWGKTALEHYHISSWGSYPTYQSAFNSPNGIPGELAYAPIQNQSVSDSHQSQNLAYIVKYKWNPNATYGSLWGPGAGVNLKTFNAQHATLWSDFGDPGLANRYPLEWVNGKGPDTDMQGAGGRMRGPYFTKDGGANAEFFGTNETLNDFFTKIVTEDGRIGAGMVRNGYYNNPAMLQTSPSGIFPGGGGAGAAQGYNNSNVDGNTVSGGSGAAGCIVVEY